jgi:anhydro-N-acetylmuramic acid kinase
MSGTSMDGVDVALIETDGERIVSFGPAGIYEYRDEERAVLRQAVADAADLSDRDARPGTLAEAEALITNVHAQAVEAFMGDFGLGREDVDVVGFHGQTVLHRPKAGLTVQLGDGPLLSEMLNLDVVYDFRAADMAAGGQGAPFVPVYHRALVEASDLARPAVAINLGGVANVTFIGRDDELLAFDTGPGNAMIDDWMFRQAGAARDENGEAAARGQTDGRRLEALLADRYFLQKPPKSLDRNAFSSSIVEGLSLEDGAATLTAFTVASLICGLAHLPATPAIFVLCGGGTRNATLVGSLRKLLPGRVELADDIGWNADAIEAQAFAYMAVRTLKGLPISFSGTTGVPAPMPGGVVARCADTREVEPANGSQGAL